MVPQEGLEPPTPSLRMRCATSCAIAATRGFLAEGLGFFYPFFALASLPLESCKREVCDSIS